MLGVGRWVNELVPAGEVNFISAKVQIEIWEDRADLQEEHAHELICIVEDGIHRPEGA